MRTVNIYAQVYGPVILFWGILLGIVVAIIAKRKNRRPVLVWSLFPAGLLVLGAVVGAVLMPYAGDILMFGIVCPGTVLAVCAFGFTPHYCPKCHKRLSGREWKDRSCPRCGSLMPSQIAEPTRSAK
jgi:peptidoglycan/LPS O-acetylase OafA/YrhL